MKNSMEVKEGAVFVCDTIAWDDGWEFDRPSMMLSPIIRCYESGNGGHERIVEDVMMDAILAKSAVLIGQDFSAEWGWRGYNLQLIRRRFRESFAGKSFPVKGYWARRSVEKILRDDGGSLTWETIIGEHRSAVQRAAAFF